MEYSIKELADGRCIVIDLVSHEQIACLNDRGAALDYINEYLEPIAA